MEKEILILTLSDKYKGSCVAGIDLETCDFIRLIDNSQPGHNSIPWDKLYCEAGAKIKLLDIVQVNRLKKVPTAVHPENYSITKESTFKIKKSHNFNCINNIFKDCPKFNKNEILGNRSHVIYNVDSVTHSLEIVPFEEGELYAVKNSYGVVKTKFDFTYDNVRYNKFSVTDPEEYLNEREVVIYESGYAVISIPDDEWSRERGFYKFVATIFHD